MDEHTPSDPSELNSGRGHISENCVEYFLFLVKQHTEDRIQLQELEAVRKTATNLCDRLTKNYLWQRDGFCLELKTSQGMTYLHGTTDYGDAVEDEWLIVYMLRELTRTVHDLWVRIADADGEILLIEAANALPKWITPGMDQNRVWIHDSKLLIIPLLLTADDQEKTTIFTLRNAVNYLRTNSRDMVHSPLIESEAFYRLEKYPNYIDHSMHYSLVTIPRKLAYILHEIPKSIPMAVEMFYLRDAFTSKQITSAAAPLAFAPEDFVTTSVQFSRVLFAQLKSQRLDPPARWKSIVRDTSETSLSNRSDLARQYMGMKLTCGYEMLAFDAERSRHRVVRELAILLQDLVEDGTAGLPSDHDMNAWPNQQRDDAEDWLDINYEDFERELNGEGLNTPRVGGSGFGDSQAQNTLRKIVSRFETFLSDDRAGLDGVELDEIGGDDRGDTDDDDDEDSEFEDKAVSFDEEDFAQMMREMMGMPVKDPKSETLADRIAFDLTPQSVPEGLENNSDDLQQLSVEMEAELKQHGALNLESEKHTGNSESDQELPRNAFSTVEDGEEELDIDYNLARNILESFKGQAGMAGPTGNLLNMMGFTLPRDEDDGLEEASPM